MAAALNVSRSTVTAALDELRADGTVESRQGSGTVVRDVHAHTIAGTRIADHFFDVGGIDLAAGNPPDASHLPPIHLDVAALLARGGGPGVQPLGLPALRAVLADRHAEHGPPHRPRPDPRDGRCPPGGVALGAVPRPARARGGGGGRRATRGSSTSSTPSAPGPSPSAPTTPDSSPPTSTGS